MAQKVQISFIGTGRYNDNREYETAPYRFPDEAENMNYSFFAAALKEHYRIDKMILIGTVHSMWEEVYNWFAHKDGSFDDEVWSTIGDHCEKAGYASPLEIPHQEKIEKALGKGSKIILVKYGINSREIEYNANKILELQQYLNRKDELYVDITHAFRSLPLYLMNLLIYIQNVSRKEIKINSICYGMLDVKRELGYAPVVEMKSLMEINEWISGAYSFMEFGNAYKISRLLDDEYKSVSQKLWKFSDIKNLNYLDALEKQVNEMNDLRTIPLPLISEPVVRPVIVDYLNTLSRCSTTSLFQFQLAKWHYEKHNYSSSYIVFIEAIISYVCELNNLDVKEKNQRNRAKNMLNNDEELKPVKNIYSEVNAGRKEIAHSVKGKKSYKQMIITLENKLKEFEKIIVIK